LKGSKILGKKRFLEILKKIKEKKFINYKSILKLSKENLEEQGLFEYKD